METITVSDLFHLLRYGTDTFFSVEFERRKASDDGRIPAGTLRKLLCRTGVSKYKQGIESDLHRDARDHQHGILTVFDIEAFHNNRNRGMDIEAAGNAAWRTIDLTTVRHVSVLGEAELPPILVEGVHQLTNAYRLNNLPRMPVD